MIGVCFEDDPWFDESLSEIFEEAALGMVDLTDLRIFDPATESGVWFSEDEPEKVLAIRENDFGGFAEADFNADDQDESWSILDAVQDNHWLILDRV